MPLVKLAKRLQDMAFALDTFIFLNVPESLQMNPSDGCFVDIPTSGVWKHTRETADSDVPLPFLLCPNGAKFLAIDSRYLGSLMEDRQRIPALSHLELERFSERF